MQTKNRLGILAAVAGVCGMGALGWWVGGMADSQHASAVPSSAALHEAGAANMTEAEIQTSPAGEREVVAADNPAPDGGRERLTGLTAEFAPQQDRPLTFRIVQDGPVQPMTVARPGLPAVRTALTNAPTDGTMVPPNGGPVNWTPPDNTLPRRTIRATDVGAAPNQPVVTITGGNGVTAIATVDGEGKITSVRITSGNGPAPTGNGAPQGATDARLGSVPIQAEGAKAGLP